MINNENILFLPELDHKIIKHLNPFKDFKNLLEIINYIVILKNLIILKISYGKLESML